MGHAKEVKCNVVACICYIALNLERGKKKKKPLCYFKVKAEGQRKGKHLALKMKVIITLAGKHPKQQAR